MRSDLTPESATLLAVALLSRGAGTRPRALVAYHAGTEYVVHEAILDAFPAFRWSGTYHNVERRALKVFGERLNDDYRLYLERGTDLTEPAWLEVSSWSELIEAYEEGRALMPGWTLEELIERCKEESGIRFPDKDADALEWPCDDTIDCPCPEHAAVRADADSASLEELEAAEEILERESR